MASSAHFGFTKLLVADLDRSAAFYKAVFGLEQRAVIESDIAGRPIKEIMFAPTADQGASFVLLTYVGTSSPADSEIILGFITGDLDALFERAVAAGGAVVQAPRDQPEHGVRVGFISDVEGHLIEVVQLIQPQ